tara:strand:- start:1142 stop:1516 length:375 start_codon:yes stop_codon:yes gene_type:complete
MSNINKELIKKINHNLVKQLLNGTLITIKDPNKIEAWEYPSNIETIYLKEEELKEKDQVKTLLDLDFIIQKKINPQDRKSVWLVNPEKIEILKELDFYFKVSKALELIDPCGLWYDKQNHKEKK